MASGLLRKFPTKVDDQHARNDNVGITTVSATLSIAVSMRLLPSRALAANLRFGRGRDADFRDFGKYDDGVGVGEN